jgi:hypothetical protein
MVRFGFVEFVVGAVSDFVVEVLVVEAEELIFVEVVKLVGFERIVEVRVRSAVA